MQTQFSKWLDQQRGDSSIRQLAKRIGFSHSHVAEVINGQKRPTWKFCAAVARNLGYSYEEVFERAELVPVRSQAEGSPK